MAGNQIQSPRESEQFYESYEDMMFDGEDSNSIPCYLPTNHNKTRDSSSPEETLQRNNDSLQKLHIQNSCNQEDDDHVNGGEISEIENPSCHSSNGGGYERGRSSSSDFGSFSSSSNVTLDDNSEMQDNTSIKWRRRRKHFFILSNSGKPIYSRYGDENKLAGFSATLQAIISFMENSGDKIRRVEAGNHQIAFMMKGPIHLVCISCTEEPFKALLTQLELLYGQMVLILTKSIEKYFRKNAKFDMRPLLGGTEAVFTSLIHSFSWNPAAFLHAYTCVPLPSGIRQAANVILQDVVSSRVIFGILMCQNKVISIAGAQKATLHPDDILLLSNFIVSSASFRNSEAFSPICIPKYSSTGFLHAYVHYLKDETFLVLITPDPIGFYHLKDCRIRIEKVLNESNVLNDVKRSTLDLGLHVEDLPEEDYKKSDILKKNERQISAFGGPSGLWHFVYKSTHLNQYVSSEYSATLNSRQAQKSLLRAYQRLHASVHDATQGPHKMQYKRDNSYTLMCWVTADFELYAAFDPLAERSAAIATCNRVCQWLRDVENEIFFVDATPFSW